MKIKKEYLDKKIGCSLSGVCCSIAMGESTLDEYALIIAGTTMRNDTDAQTTFGNFYLNTWNEMEYLFTQKQREVLCTYSAGEAAVQELMKEYRCRNLQRIQEVFWEVINSGKLYQPRLKVCNEFCIPHLSDVYLTIPEFVSELQRFINHHDEWLLNTYSHYYRHLFHLIQHYFYCADDEE